MQPNALLLRLNFGEYYKTLADRPAPGPTVQWPLHTASSCQVHPRGDTYFGGIPNFLLIS